MSENTVRIGGAGMASMRSGALGKGMVQILLSMPIQVPVALLGQV